MIETENFIVDEGVGKTDTLDFRNGVTEVTLSFAITSDTDEETNGSITLALLDSSAVPPAYNLATAPDNSATLNVIDDDSLPVIEITADNGEVVESIAMAAFNLSATDLKAQQLSRYL